MKYQKKRINIFYETVKIWSKLWKKWKEKIRVSAKWYVWIYLRMRRRACICVCGCVRLCVWERERERERERESRKNEL